MEVINDVIDGVNHFPDPLTCVFNFKISNDAYKYK